MRKILLLSPIVLALVPAHAASEEASAAPGPGPASEAATQSAAIVVVATGLPLAPEEAGQAISVIDAATIEAVQGADPVRVLRRLPGTSITRNGGFGAFTGLRVRGAGADQVLVLVDGVRMAEVASPGGGFDFGTLSLAGVEQIELLRGPNSVVWGSDALGGVMNIATRHRPGLSASLEYGGDERATAQGALGLASGPAQATVSAGYVTAEGFSSAASGSEPDGIEQWQVAARGTLDLGAGFALVADGRLARADLDIDGFPPPLFALGDTLERQETQQISGRLGADYARGALALRTGIALSETQRDLFDDALGDAPQFASDGRSVRAEVFGRLGLPGAFALDFGADHEWTRFAAESAFSSDRGRAEVSSAHALLGWRAGGVQLAAGLRHDDHSRFGGATTLGAHGSWELAPGWRLRAAYGEGFKAPTLFQLFSDFGNEALRPERSRSWDGGLRYESAEGSFNAALSLFRRDSRNLIDFVSCFASINPICAGRPFGTYDNVGRARAEGFEIEAAARLGQTLRAGGHYSFVSARDRTRGSALAGNRLARRPRHAASAWIDWQSPLGAVLGAELRLVGDSFDDATNSVRIDGHALTDLRASLPLGEALELYGRIENVTNARYEEVAGYGVEGRAAYIGARLRL